MKLFAKAAASVVLAGAILFPVFEVKARAAEPRTVVTTTATGYTSASQVVYKTSDGYIANWGARGEDCSFLSKYAESFYTGSYVYDVISEKSGGTEQSNAPNSALYRQLKSLMTSKHTHETSYNETREQYRYTDCVKNDTAHISSFYSGKTLSGTWDSGKTWNREHTWPNSKGLAGNDENDIMMLRPTSVQENSNRGNKAYGKSSAYFDPGESTRGDCARIVLYVYVRWGNTGRMWGTSGVMENMNVLLEWMTEDPVDTWEMGRNDAVQKITGTRNVFVDYPEYAWLLFGQKIPTNMVTPSGEAKQSGIVNDSSSSSSSSSSDSVLDSSDSVVNGSSDSSSNGSQNGNSSGVTSDEHVHAYGQWHTTLRPTEASAGEKTRFCQTCGAKQTEAIPPLTASESDSGEGETLGCAASVYGSTAAVVVGLVVLVAVRRRKRYE